MLRPSLTISVVILLALVPAVQAQQEDSSVGYWAGDRGAAIDLAVDTAESAPPVPAGQLQRDDTWGSEPVEDLTTHRSRVVLRGGWNVISGDAGTWELLRTVVPGQKGQREVRRTPPWAGRFRWYAREIAIPEAWAGRSISLDFRMINRSALVFIDGKPQGVVALGGEVDITGGVTAGRTAVVAVCILASERVPSASEEWLGLVGDVHLISRPQGARVTDVYVQTSTRRGVVDLDIELSYLERGGPLQVTAEMVTDSGTIEQTFRTTVAAPAARQHTVKVSWPWPTARQWDLDTPTQYLLRLRVTGDGIDDVYAQEFGFREFWIEGKQFMLNGSEVKLRSAHGNWFGLNSLEGREGTPGWDLRSWFDSAARLGFNYFHFTPDIAWPTGQEDFAILGSERGMLMAGIQPSGRRVKFDDAAARENYRRGVEFVVRRMRNYPAVVMWVSSGPPSMPADDQNPWLLGQQSKLVKEPRPPLFQLQKSVDPNRPLYWHAYTPGDLASVNMYLCFTPAQEREEWVSHFMQAGEVPVHASEFGMPIAYHLLRWRTHEHNAPNPLMHEPFIIEYAAALHGPQMYPQLTQEEWRLACWGWNDTGVKVPVADPNSFRGVSMYAHGGDLSDEARFPFTASFLAHFTQGTWRSWRTMGMPIMPNPWMRMQSRERSADRWRTAPIHDDEMNPILRALVPANQPTVAYIGGTPEAVTDKAHGFWGGGAIPTKSLVLINDTRQAQPYEFTWTVTVGGRQVGSGRFRGSLAVTARHIEPITVRLPVVASTSDGVIDIRGRIGTTEHQDTFAFRVFPAAKPIKATVRVWDPVGRTTAMLRKIGYTITPWDGQRTTDLVVIGSEALRSQTPPPGDLRALANGGGRVLVMAHHPDWVEQTLGLRVAKFMSRQVFRVNHEHPVVAGLDDQDLRDWSGESTLVEAKPRTYREVADYNMPKYGWRWGNRGGLTSGAVEVPHHAGWRPILVCEFGLQYSPLMELDLGQGRVTWCLLDLEDYVPSEPAATILARQLLRHVSEAALAPRVPTVTIGLGDRQRSLLDRMGLIATPAQTLPHAPALVVLGDRAGLDDAALSAFVAQGGRIVVLPRTDASDGILGAQLTAVQETGPNLLWPTRFTSEFGLKEKPWTTQAELEGKDVPVPNWSELAGLGIADFHRRGFIDYLALTDGCDVAMRGLVGRRTIGKGSVVWCQIDPDSLDVEKKPYLRLTRWRQTRIVAQLLANSGAQFTRDHGLLAVGTEPALTTGAYHADYIDNHNFGDNPFRYWRW